MQILPIDLTKNREVADLLVDMQPGQRVYACLTIKDKDEKNANLRIEEIVATPEDLPKPDEKYEDEDDGVIAADGEGGAEAEGSGREQSNGSSAAPMDSAGQSGPVGG
jgi:hypothetical protein